MFQGAVYASGGGEPHQVELPAGLFHVVVCCLYLLVFQKFVVAARHVDLHQVLVDDPSCTQVEVSYFGVTHLPFRKTYRLTACLQVAERVFLPQGVDVRSALCEDGVCPVMFALAPSVEDH